MEERGKLDKGAIASLALGLLFWLWLLNFIFGAIAVYLGLESLKKGKGKRMGAARAFAAAGILLGALPFYFGLMSLLNFLLKLDNVLLTETVLLTTPAFLAILLIMLKVKRLL